MTTKTSPDQPPTGYDPSALEDVIEAHRYVETHQETRTVVLTLDGAR